MSIKTLRHLIKLPQKNSCKHSLSEKSILVRLFKRRGRLFCAFRVISDNKSDQRDFGRWTLAINTIISNKIIKRAIQTLKSKSKRNLNKKR